MTEEKAEIVNELSKSKDAEFNKSTEILIDDTVTKDKKPKTRWSKIELIFTVVVIIHIIAITAVVVTLIFVVANQISIRKNTSGSNSKLNYSDVSTSTSSNLKSANCFGYTISNCSQECGLNFLSSRIVGGVEAAPNSWPSTVYLKIFYSYKIWKFTYSVDFVCAGTLIDEYTILTVAHCVQPKILLKTLVTSIPAVLDYVDVIFGAHDLNNYEYSIRSSDIIRHENYDSTNLLNDIALVKLSKKAILGQKVQIACLPTDTINIQSNTNSVAVGWGITSLDSDASDTLQQVNLTIYDSNFCSNTALNNNGIDSTQLCAGDLTGGRDTCKGDGGGPLFIKQTVNGVTKFVVAGLTSYGRGCGNPNLPGIYTRTSSYICWILENI